MVRKKGVMKNRIRKLDDLRNRYPTLGLCPLYANISREELEKIGKWIGCMQSVMMYDPDKV
jgi:hypothetical protein